LREDFSIESLLTEAGLEFKEGNSGWITVHECPFCSREDKFSINKESGVYKCWSSHCGEKGGPVALVEKILNKSKQQAYEYVFGKKDGSQVEKDLFDVGSTKFSENKYIKKYASKKTTKPQDKTEELVLDPRQFEDINESHIWATQYLEKTRGVSIKEAKKMGVKVWSSRKRIVFPVTKDFEIVGYVARDYTDTDKRKALNSEGSFRSNSVWNLDSIKKGQSELIITEGIFDAIKADITRSVAVLGIEVSDGQIELIKSKEVQNIYICFDPGEDEYKMAKKLARNFLFTNSKVHIVRLPVESGEKRDPGSMTKEEFEVKLRSCSEKFMP
jgi:DNA primase